MGFGGGKAHREREGPAKELSIRRRRFGDELVRGVLASINHIGPHKQQPVAAARPGRGGTLHRRDGCLRRGHLAARDDRGRRPDGRPYRAGDAAGDRLPGRLRRRNAAARRLLRCPRARSPLRGVRRGVRFRIWDHRDRRTVALCGAALVGRGPRPAGTRWRRPGATDTCDRRRPLPRQPQNYRAWIRRGLAGGGQRLRAPVRRDPRRRGIVRRWMAICFLVQRAPGGGLWNGSISTASTACARHSNLLDARRHRLGQRRPARRRTRSAGARSLPRRSSQSCDRQPLHTRGTCEHPPAWRVRVAPAPADRAAHPSCVAAEPAVRRVERREPTHRRRADGGPGGCALARQARLQPRPARLRAPADPISDRRTCRRSSRRAKTGQR